MPWNSKGVLLPAHPHTADEVAPTTSRLWVPGGGTDNQVLKKVGGVPTWAADANTTYAVPTQAEAEAGATTTGRAFSAQRVNQAIQALAPVKADDPRLSDARTPVTHSHGLQWRGAWSSVAAYEVGDVVTLNPTAGGGLWRCSQAHSLQQMPFDSSVYWERIGVNAAPDQTEAEAGISLYPRAWTAQRVNQAIQALAPVKSLGNLRVDVAGKVSITDQLYKDGEIWHKIGAAGEPAFVNGWQNFNQSNEVYFRKDSSGIVHLVGRVFKPTAASGESDIFTLPDGYRPTMSPKDFLAASAAGPIRGRVQTNGSLSIFDPFANGWVSVAMSVPAM